MYSIGTEEKKVINKVEESINNRHRLIDVSNISIKKY